MQAIGYQLSIYNKIRYTNFVKTSSKLKYHGLYIKVERSEIGILDFVDAINS